VKQHNLLKAATAALAIFVFGVQSASANWIVTQNSGTGTSSSVSGTLSGTGPTVYNNTLYDSKNWTKPGNGRDKEIPAGGRSLLMRLVRQQRTPASTGATPHQPTPMLHGPIHNQ